jgi:ubiquinone/menaquinone biosynthesis C-methylase UbiE
MTNYGTDPKKIELQTINKYVDFKEKNILEVGCGNGRLTYQFADIARKVVAIDPDVEEIKHARKDLPENLGSKLEFHIQSAENLSFIYDSFDIALFSYSLCCMDSLQTMQTSMDEVQQRLKPDGFIAILQPSFQIPFKRGIINYLISKNPDYLVYGVVDDWLEKIRDARFAVKYATLVEKKLDLIAEEEFSFKIVHDTTAEALYWVIKWGAGSEAYQKLDASTKGEIDKILEAMTTSQGVFIPETVVLTVLRKSNNLI